MKTKKIAFAFVVIACVAAFVKSTTIRLDITTTTVETQSEWHTVDSWEFKLVAGGISAPSAPFDWTPLTNLFRVAIAPFLPLITIIILDYLRNRVWMKKYKGVIVARERL